MNHRPVAASVVPRQRGAVLIVSLVLLVVLTILGVSAMSTSNMENMMAVNSQFQVEALANAEVMLRTGEQDVDGIVSDGQALDFDTSDDHYYNVGEIDPAQHSWNFDYATTSDGKYAIEYAGARPIPGESEEVGSPIAGSYVYLFLVDSQNQTSKGATRNVQSVYVTGTAP